MNNVDRVVIAGLIVALAFISFSNRNTMAQTKNRVEVLEKQVSQVTNTIVNLETFANNTLRYLQAADQGFMIMDQRLKAIESNTTVKVEEKSKKSWF